MAQLFFPFPPQEATRQLLKNLPSLRMREVLEQRFGLKGKPPATLEAIGKGYKITRERVRQIERDALTQVKKTSDSPEVAPLFETLSRHLLEHGAVMEERQFFASLADARFHPHIRFSLEAGNRFIRLQENDEFHARWAAREESARKAEKAVTESIRELEREKRLVMQEELFSILARNSKLETGVEPSRDALASYLGISKLIGINPYGEYGVVTWPAVRPSGVKDKAYVAFSKAGKPMHFREVARAIDRAGWSSRKAHPQTVHNELIKDNRFVLVGRGLYALKEWGYEPGPVREVLVSILGRAKKPLMEGEVIQSVLAKRMVKPQTILLSLKNKSLFRRTGDGYTLA